MEKKPLNAPTQKAGVLCIVHHTRRWVFYTLGSETKLSFSNVPTIFFLWYLAKMLRLMCVMPKHIWTLPTLTGNKYLPLTAIFNLYFLLSFALLLVKLYLLKYQCIHIQHTYSFLLLLSLACQISVCSSFAQQTVNSKHKLLNSNN